MFKLSEHCLCSGQQTKLNLLVLFLSEELNLFKVSSQGNVLLTYGPHKLLSPREYLIQWPHMDHHKFEVNQITKGFSIL